MTIEAHELAEFFDPLPPEELERLADDIGENGLRESITLLGGKVLDGRNRLAALAVLAARGIEVQHRFEQWTAASPDDTPLAFTISKNLARRHLSDDARALIAEKIATYRRGGAGPHHPGKFVTLGQAATMLNVSASKVRVARDIRLHGDETDIAKVRLGEAKLGSVRAEVLARAGKAPPATPATRAKQERQAEAALPRLLAAIDAARKCLKLEATGERRGFYNTVQRVLARGTAEEIALLEAGEIELYNLDDKCKARYEPTLDPKRVRGLMAQIAACADRLALLDLIGDRAAQLEGAAQLVDRVSKDRRQEVLRKVVSALRLPLAASGRAAWSQPESDQPKPPAETVEDFLARGGEIKRMPIAAVGPGTAMIPPADAAAIAAHAEKQAPADSAVRARRAAVAGEASRAHWRGKKVDALLSGAAK